MELNEMRKIAESATPGPWKEDVDQRGDCVVWGPNGRFLLNAQAEPHWLEYPDETRSVAFDVDRRDCTHIATFDPPTVLALITELETFRRRLDAMRRQRDGYRNQLRKTEQQVQRVRAFLEYRKANSAVARDGLRALDGDGRG